MESPLTLTSAFQFITVSHISRYPQGIVSCLPGCEGIARNQIAERTEGAGELVPNGVKVLAVDRSLFSTTLSSKSLEIPPTHLLWGFASVCCKELPECAIVFLCFFSHLSLQQLHLSHHGG